MKRLSAMASTLAVTVAFCAQQPTASAQASDLRFSIFRPDLTIASEIVKCDVPAGRSSLRLDFLRGNADLASLQVFALDHADSISIVGQTKRNELPNAVFLELDAKAASSERFELRYAVRGFQTVVVYEATFDASTKQLDLSQDLEVHNDSGESFRSVTVDALFGEVKTVPSTVMQYGRTAEQGQGPAGLPAEPLLKDVAEHVVVHVGDRLELTDGVADRHRVLNVKGVPVAIEYRYRADQNGGRVSRVIKAKNVGNDGGTIQGLGGQSLLPGVLLFSERGNGSERFVTATLIGATAPGADLELGLGNADDLFVEREQTEYQRVDLVFGEYNRALVSYGEEEAYRLKLRNHSAESRSLTIHEVVGGTETFEVVESSAPATRRDRQLLEFKVDVPAGQELILTYRLKKSNVRVG